MPPWRLARQQPIAWANRWRWFISTYLSALASDPADKDATSVTKNFHLQLRTAVGRGTKRLIIGQELRGWDTDHPFDQPISGLTPKPALLEVDLKDFRSYFHPEDGIAADGQPRDERLKKGLSAETDAAIDRDDSMIQLLVDHARKSGVVGFCIHLGNPFNLNGGAQNRKVRNDDGTERDMTAADLHQLTDPNTQAGKQWKKGLDRAAEIIERINKGVGAPVPTTIPDVTILFRPLHESNQLVQLTDTGFWWSYWGQAAFAPVWQDAFTYLTQTKKLHNLLWVFSATTKIQNGPLDDFTSHYPGDNLVDIVGMDIYNDSLYNLDGWYEAILKKGKPVALTEYGPDQNGLNQSNKVVIDAIHSRFPNLVYATCWYTSGGNNYQISDKADTAALLTDPWSITVP
jgi:hypothetical protein